MAKWRKFDDTRLNMYELDENLAFANSDLPIYINLKSSVIYTLLVGMAYTLQARSRYIDVQNYPLLMAIWEYPFRHALATFLA